MQAYFNRFNIRLSLSDARSVSQPGDASENVEALRLVPYVKSQLDRLDTEAVRAELKEYGAWDAEQLSDHDANLTRILWIAGCNISEERAQASRR
jgi:hypothetical protein